MGLLFNMENTEASSQSGLSYWQIVQLYLMVHSKACKIIRLIIQSTNITIYLQYVLDIHLFLRLLFILHQQPHVLMIVAWFTIYWNICAKMGYFFQDIRIFYLIKNVVTSEWGYYFMTNAMKSTKGNSSK